MAHHVVFNPDGLDYEFEGEILIETDSAIGNVTIYRTESGRFVLRQIEISRPGILSLDRTQVFASREDLAEALGYSDPAKEIRERLGLKRSQPI